MPYSFTQIQKEKSRTITAAFLFLVGLYFLTFWVIPLLIRNHQYLNIFDRDQALSLLERRFQWFDWQNLFFIFFVAVIVAGLQWVVTVFGLVPRMNRILQARFPDPQNLEEKTFQNIVEEVSVATGGMKIQPMVIPSMMLNACAYADGQSTPVIAVTSGVLHKLNRSQIEAIVAHEAGHVVSGDSEQTTIISSMFEIFGAALLAMRTVIDAMDERPTFETTWESRGSGGRRSSQGGLGLLIIYIAIIMFIVWIVDKLAMLMRMFISREREYRADAISVQLTRNPLALAEALYIVSHHRHSLYPGYDSLQTLFFINTADSLWDQGQDFVSDLFSTHPPVEERIKILLSMAYAQEEVLETALKAVNLQEEEEIKARQQIIGKAQGGLWFVKTPGQIWSGPHQMSALASFSWITPETLIKKMGENSTIPFKNIESYMAAYQKLIDQQSNLACPACQQQMVAVQYEHNNILQCSHCQGYLVTEDAVAAILQRKEKEFDARILNAAQTLLNEAPVNNLNWNQATESDRMYRCEKCADHPHKLKRKLFNHFYPVEVDKCFECGLIWFDKDELEIMQSLYELRDARPIPPPQNSGDK